MGSIFPNAAVGAAMLRSEPIPTRDLPGILHLKKSIAHAGTIKPLRAENR
jgi:hypothetical protein